MFNLSYANFANAWRRFAELDGEQLLADLGCDSQSAQLGNGAILTSLALLSLGIPLAGSQRIATRPLAGGRAFNGANQLADWLGERFVETFSATREAQCKSFVGKSLIDERRRFFELG